jgi:hypothetical protein
VWQKQEAVYFVTRNALKENRGEKQSGQRQHRITRNARKEQKGK